MRWAVAQGLDPKAPDEHGQTSLHRADSLEVARYLLAQGVGVNVQDDEGSTPWMEAAKGRELELVKFYLEHGADTNLRDEKGRTLLHLAAASNDAETVKMVLAAGLSASAQDDEGNTPLHSVAKGIEGGDVVALLLAAGGPIEALNDLGRTPLHEAAAARNPVMAKALLKAGAAVQAQDRFCRSPLHTAAAGQRVFNTVKAETAIVYVLMEHGADPASRDQLGDTPRDTAIRNRNWDFLDALSTSQRKRDGLED